MNQQEKVKAIAKILKSKFTNLSVDETIDLSFKILFAITDTNDTTSTKKETE